MTYRERCDAHPPEPQPGTYPAARHAAPPTGRSRYLIQAAQALAPYVPLIIDIGHKAGLW